MCGIVEKFQKRILTFFIQSVIHSFIEKNLDHKFWQTSTRYSSTVWVENRIFVKLLRSRDGILGHQFDKKTRVFCSKLLRIFWNCCVLVMEFLDINLTKDSSLLLQVIHSLSTDEFFLLNPHSSLVLQMNTKNPRNKKSLVYSWVAFCRNEKWG